MIKIDKEKLRNNILYYGGIKGLKIGDIERHIDRRLGIVSRWARNDTENVPLDDIYNIALLLEVSIETLITTDVESLLREQELIELKERRELLDRQIKKLEEGYNDD